MTYAFPFMNRFYGKSGLLNMIIFSVSALLIDGKCVMLLYFVVRVIPVKSGHGHFGQIRFLMGKSSKDSIYK